MRERCAWRDQTNLAVGTSHSATKPIPPAETSRSPCGANRAKIHESLLTSGFAGDPWEKVTAFVCVATSHDSMMPPERHTARFLLSGEKPIRTFAATGNVN